MKPQHSTTSSWQMREFQWTLGIILDHNGFAPTTTLRRWELNANERLRKLEKAGDETRPASCSMAETLEDIRGTTLEDVSMPKKATRTAVTGRETRTATRHCVSERPCSRTAFPTGHISAGIQFGDFGVEQGTPADRRKLASITIHSGARLLQVKSGFHTATAEFMRITDLEALTSEVTKLTPLCPSPVHSSVDLELWY